jgi:hypothetical protein
VITPRSPPFHHESPPLVARLIGVGKYDREEYKHLHPEGDTNAKSLEKFLKNDPTLNRDIDIEMVIESVTRDNIFETLNELRNSVDRSKAIVVFFSGYGGSTGPGRTSIICPADIGVDDKSQGITDRELAQCFDSISRFRGNNVVSNSLSMSCEMNRKFISHISDIFAGLSIIAI